MRFIIDSPATVDPSVDFSAIARGEVFHLSLGQKTSPSIYIKTGDDKATRLRDGETIIFPGCAPVGLVKAIITWEAL